MALITVRRNKAGIKLSFSERVLPSVEFYGLLDRLRESTGTTVEWEKAGHDWYLMGDLLERQRVTPRQGFTRIAEQLAIEELPEGVSYFTEDDVIKEETSAR